MATVTRPPSRPRPSLAESHRRIRHPLQRLRRYIRLYVAVECVLLVLLFLAAWFWVGFVLDYGLFKLTAWLFPKSPPLDWADTAPWLFQILRVVLALCLVALVAYKAGLRLFREFRDRALALLLEQRFPKLLGDRLITAVELADTKKHVKYGYSRAMIEQTIHDAAERVDQLPIRQVFNWGRLVRHGLVVAAASVGVYLLAGLWFCLAGTSKGHESSLTGFARLNDVSGIWGQRNLLADKKYWHRQAQLELVDVPEDGLRVGRDLGACEVRVRAVKWVVEDPQGRFGWRALRYDELTPELLGSGDDVPRLPINWVVRPEYFGLFGPAAEGGIPGQLPWAALYLTTQGRKDWTVDRVELELARQELDKLVAIRDVLRRLGQALAKDERVRHQQAGGDLGGGKAGWYYRDYDPLTAAAAFAGFTGLDGGPLGATAYAQAAPPQDPWRALSWHDVRRLGPDCGLADVPALPAEWTIDAVDDVAHRLDTAELDQMLAIRDQVLARLEDLTDTSRLNRPVRKLEVPDDVKLTYWGKKARGSSEATLQKRGDNEYSTRLTDLADSVVFRARAFDYFTPETPITVVPAPYLTDLEYDAEKPAYLYYRLDRDPKLLKGQRRVFRGLKLSTSVGETNKIEVPAGTSVVLRGTADRNLRAAPRLLPVPGKEGLSVHGVAALDGDDPKQFTVRVDDVRAEVEFRVEFTDADFVSGVRTVKITPAEDKVPEVLIEVEKFVRELKEGKDDLGFRPLVEEYEDYNGKPVNVRGYRIVTVSAFLPLKGTVSDDHGLTRLDYAFTYFPVKVKAKKEKPKEPKKEGDDKADKKEPEPPKEEKKPAEDKEEERRRRARSVIYAQVVNHLRAGGDGVMPALVLLANLRDRAPDLPKYTVPVLQFQDKMGQRPGIRVANLDELDKELKKKLRDEGVDPATVKDVFNLVPDAPAEANPKAGLDLRDTRRLKLERPLKVIGDIQPRYVLRLNVEAYDNDAEAGPHKGDLQAVLNFLVVSEEELLADMLRDQGILHGRLKEVAGKLEEAEKRIVKTNQDLAAKPKDPREFSPMSGRMKNTEKDLDEQLAEAQKVFEDLENILKEMYANRMEPGTIREMEDIIVKPLKLIMEGDPTSRPAKPDSAAEGNFYDTKAAVTQFRTILDNDSPPELKADLAALAGQDARHQMAQLRRKLEALLSRMEEETNIKRLIGLLTKIHDEQHSMALRVQEIYEKVLESLLGGLDQPGDKKPEKKPEDKKP